MADTTAEGLRNIAIVGDHDDTVVKASLIDFAPGALAEEIRTKNAPVKHEMATVRGPVQLRSLNVRHRLELRNVIFEDLVDLRDTHFRKTVDLRGCRFRRGLVMEGARIDGSLLMDEVTLMRSPTDPHGRAARMTLLRVGGDLLARGLRSRGAIELTGAEIHGRLNLSSLARRRTRCVGNLVLNAARVGADVSLAGALVGGDLEAEAVVVGANLMAGPLRANSGRDEGAVLRVADIRGKVSLGSARITAMVDFSAALLGSDLNIQAAEIGGGCFCRTVRGHQPELKGEVIGSAARIRATLDLSGAKIHKDVVFEGADIQGLVFFANGWKVEDGGPDGGPAVDVAPREPDLRTHLMGELKLSQITINGSLTVGDALLDAGATLNDAIISGTVSFSRSEVGESLHLSGAKISGGFFCRSINGGYPEVKGSIVGRAAQFGKGLFLSGVLVRKNVLFAGARVDGPVEMHARVVSSLDSGDEPDAQLSSLPVTPTGALAARVYGTVDLGHITVGGAVRLAGLRTGKKLVLDGATVAGFLDLAQAEIGHSLDEVRLDPDTNKEAVLKAAGANRSDGGVSGTGMRLQGGARLIGMFVTSDLNLQGARLEGGLQCGAEVVERKAVGHRTVIGGSVVLSGSTVLSHADFRGAWIGDTLALEGATVDGMLRCRLVAPPDAEWSAHVCTYLKQINLRNCVVDYLDLQGVERRGKDNDRKKDEHKDGLRGPAQIVRVLMEGCQFRELSVPAKEQRSARDRGKPVEKDYLFLFQAETREEFRQGNYMLLERWLNNAGDDDGAETVYGLMRERRRDAMRRWQHRLSDWLVCRLRAAALRFQLLIVLSLLAYSGSVFIFRDKDSVVWRSSDANTPAKEESGRVWSTSDAALVAAQIHLPMFSFPGEDRWEPARHPIARGGGSFALRYDGYAMLISLLSYAVVPLVIGGIATTWLRKGKKAE